MQGGPKEQGEWKESGHLLSFTELEQHSVVGEGLSGTVRLVRHRPTQTFYAMKKMLKASILGDKQAEHALNERMILEETYSKFCIGLVSAFQDCSNLYLLQVD